MSVKDVMRWAYWRPPTEAAYGQGTLTAGNGPVGSGTKWALPRDIVESATKAVMMIAISRIIEPLLKIPAFGGIESGEREPTMAQRHHWRDNLAADFDRSI